MCKSRITFTFTKSHTFFYHSLLVFAITPDITHSAVLLLESLIAVSLYPEHGQPNGGRRFSQRFSANVSRPIIVDVVGDDPDVWFMYCFQATMCL